MLSLREYRSKLKGFADLLGYAVIVDDRTILLKNGAFMTSYYFRGQDLQSSTHAEMAAISAQVNAGLIKLGTGWMMHVDAIKVPATNYPEASRSHFPGLVSRLIDEERRAQYEREGAHFETVYALTLTYMTPPEIQQKVMAMFIDDDTPKGTVQTNYTVLLDNFKAYVNNVMDSLEANLSVRPMEGGELLTYLHSCITGLTHKVRVPKISMYLDSVLASKMFFPGLKPRVGQRHIRAITITGFPAETQPAILDQLNSLPIEYRWSTRFIALDPIDAKKILQRYRRNWFQKRHGLAGMVRSAMGGQGDTWGNADAVAMAKDADGAVNDCEEGLVRYGMYTACIVVNSESAAEADEHARLVSKTLEHFQFASNIETLNANEAFLGTLPGEGFANVRRVPIHTLNLADLLPLTAIWAGRETHPCPFYPPNSPPLMYAATSGATPFRLNLHVGDVGHTGVFGPIGAGKTTALNLIVSSHFRYENAEAIIFDNKYGAYVLAQSEGGAHYDIAGERGKPAFCPLAQLETPSDRAWSKEYLELLYQLQVPRDKKATPKQLQEIHRIVELVHETTKHLEVGERSRARTITHFMIQCQDPEVKDALSYYTMSGTAGELLDAESDSNFDGRLLVFETMHLMERGEKEVIPVLEYLFRCVTRRLRGQPLLIVLDEAWLMLSHWFFLEKLVAWLRLLRSFNAHIVFATQSLAEAVNSPVADIIMSSLATKILLPNPEAETEQIMPLYRKIGLNDRQIRNLARARKKRDYYLMSQEGRRMVDLGLGKVALAFVGASGIQAVEECDALIGAHGDDWVPHWMASHDVPEDWIKYYNQLSRDRIGYAQQAA
ncbi:hypothetical protein DBB29_12290 [Pandoraea cepalis]|uniref:CagE TrbE VirB component of type IV transporter system central domain-containing protein n=1 Tax=Pandoraea cepalis TaxID=2508294 RepID=A0AAW7MHD6_9BURK|nr:transporter [Pandoraea cepalis]MDN4572048.1 hypothetical protein [Pandoraea cepalis]MDN4578894.1 hypothetical protein [Pandoraea cepalis]